MGAGAAIGIGNVFSSLIHSVYWKTVAFLLFKKEKPFFLFLYGAVSFIISGVWGYLLAGGLLGDIVEPFLGSSSSGGVGGLPGPSGPPTSFFPIVPDSEVPDSEEIMSPYVSTPEINGTLIEMEPPLISDSQRREEISRILWNRFNEGREPNYEEAHVESLVNFERKLEYELRQEFTEESIRLGRSSWRETAFLPENKNLYITLKYLKTLMSRYETKSLVSSGPYKRVLRGVKNRLTRLVRKPS